MRSLVVHGGNRRLQLIGPDRPSRQGPAYQRNALSDRIVVPEAAVLVRQRDQLAAGAGARRSPCVCQEHQREQARDLAVVGEQPVDDASEPDRFAGQLGALEVGAGTGRISLVEDQVEHLQHGSQPLLPLPIGRHPKGRTGRLDAVLGAADALCHGRLGHQESVRDLDRRQPADSAEGQRDL
jgi:hypothetical protein